MDEKVRSSWSLKAVQAGGAPQATSSLGAGAIAALPVLPSAFSSASAESRRPADAPMQEGAPAPGEGIAEARPIDPAPVVRPTEGAPALASDAQALAQAPVRISDLAAPGAGETEAPACRSGDAASLDPGQILPTPKQDEDRSGGERQGTRETPLPHCIIEFDPDADDGDVVAHAPTPQTVQVAAKSAGLAAPSAQARASGDKPPQGDAASATAAAPAEAAPAKGSAEQAPAPASPPAPPSAAGTPMVVTEAARGIGTAVIDPLVPLDSIMFGSDQPALSPAEASLSVAVAPDPVADALALSAIGPQPELFPGFGTDPFIT